MKYDEEPDCKLCDIKLQLEEQGNKLDEHGKILKMLKSMSNIRYQEDSSDKDEY
jgi:hypothetical protein